WHRSSACVDGCHALAAERRHDESHAALGANPSFAGQFRLHVEFVPVGALETHAHLGPCSATSFSAAISLFGRSRSEKPRRGRHNRNYRSDLHTRRGKKL